MHVPHHGPEGQRRRKRRRRGGNVGESADDGSDDRGEDRVIVAEGVRNRPRARLDANVHELTSSWMTGRRITEGRRSVSGDVGEEKRIRRRRRKTSTECPMTRMGTRGVDEELGGPEEDVLMMMGGGKRRQQARKENTAPRLSTIRKRRHGYIVYV